MSRTRNIALIIAVIGALNWGVYGIFGFDVVAEMSGGSEQLLARFIYVLIGVAGAYSVGLLVRDEEKHEASRETRPKVNVI